MPADSILEIQLSL